MKRHSLNTENLIIIQKALPTSIALHHTGLVVVIVVAAFTQRTKGAFFLLQTALITKWGPIFFVKMSHVSHIAT